MTNTHDQNKQHRSKKQDDSEKLLFFWIPKNDIYR